MKRFLIVLLIVSLVMGLVACASNQVEEPVVTEEAPVVTEPEPTPEPPPSKILINFAVQADSTPALEKLVEAFNEQSEMYEVKATIMTNDSGQMHDQLLNSLSSKSGEYDVISMDVVWAGEFAAAGYLEPIDQLLMDKGWKPTDFNAGSMDSGKYKGKNYVLPYFPDLGFIYFRSDIVSAEDVAILQSGDYTFDDLIAMGEKYQGEMGTKHAFVYQSKQYEGLTCNLNEFSGNWTDIEGGLNYMKQMMDKNLTPEDILNYTEGEVHNALLNGEAVFARNWPYVNGMLQSGEHDVKVDQIGYAPLPKGGTVGGWILGINANSQNPEGAKEFLTFLAGPEGQKINAIEGSYLPGFNALLEDEEVLAANKLLTDEGFQNALARTIPRPVVPNYSEVSDIIQISAHEYLSGNSTIEDAVVRIQEALAE
ncbi:ABC transporter substrate-binding protein [Tissierella sp. Yu-01]|uniref:ABC transporter substrate-binding protein n=1 Tax=Tissierella sp. Yu-01 TaxID=3035694 RepID=UPI00240E4575|nr:ABC transporter substrate-binding protein [Tissierella sp. Yu-01]WFA07963.1 ABC transporter substrate-binding protein [Tissierella sp. Yu-01]